MYLHLGQNEIVSDHRIIGIFDLDKCSYGKRTREYLAAALTAAQFPEAGAPFALGCVAAAGAGGAGMAALLGTLLGEVLYQIWTNVHSK